MSLFQPLVAPLFPIANMGGTEEKEGRLAAKALVRIGPSAIPTLLGKLKSDNDQNRWSAMLLLGQIGEPKELILSSARSLLADSDDYVRRTSIDDAPGQPGILRALPAVPDLEAQFDRERRLLTQANMAGEYEYRELWIQLALIHIQGVNPARLNAIAKHLQSGDHDSASYAATSLGDLSAAARDEEPALLAAMKHSDAQVRSNAADAIGKIGVDDDAAIEALIDRLQNDTEKEVRRNCAFSLGAIGPKARAALPALRDAGKGGGEWWVIGARCGHREDRRQRGRIRLHRVSHRLRSWPNEEQTGHDNW